MAISLFSGQTSNGNSSSFNWAGYPLQGGEPAEGTFAVDGTTNGATTKLQFSPDGGTTWLDVDDVNTTFSDTTGAGNFKLGPCLVRSNLADAGASTSVNARIL